jgi:hypothetical protein
MPLGAHEQSAPLFEVDPKIPQSGVKISKQAYSNEVNPIMYTVKN